MTVDDKRKFLEKAIGELMVQTSGASEPMFRKEMGDWMVAFRTCQVHWNVVTTASQYLEEAVNSGQSEEVRGRITTTLALGYFLLGRRAGKAEEKE